MPKPPSAGQPSGCVAKNPWPIAFFAKNSDRCQAMSYLGLRRCEPFFCKAEIACPVLRTPSEMPEVVLLGVVFSLIALGVASWSWQPTPSRPGRAPEPSLSPAPNLRRCEATLGWLQALDLDVIVVMAYGQLLASSAGAMKEAVVNVHTSLLPKYRGASATIQWAIWNGDAQSGVSLMQMDEGMDTGPIIATGSIPHWKRRRRSSPS